jgi:hypothetical protein
MGKVQRVRVSSFSPDADSYKLNETTRIKHYVWRKVSFFAEDEGCG